MKAPVNGLMETMLENLESLVQASQLAGEEANLLNAVPTNIRAIYLAATKEVSSYLIYNVIIVANSF
jgi:hypothetical protein